MTSLVAYSAVCNRTEGITIGKIEKIMTSERLPLQFGEHGLRRFAFASIKPKDLEVHALHHSEIGARV